MVPTRRLLVLLLVWCSSAGAAGSQPNVILITLDTVRADRMGFLGSRLGLTPSLDSLARQSIVFTHAYSQVPLTTASHATILTGTYPQFHQVTDFGVPLSPDLPFAPDLLRAHGYKTAAFIGSLILDPIARSAPGFDRGFDTYDAGFHRRRPGEDRYRAIERRASDVVEHALTWLSRHPKGPFFVWVHLYDAHDPYDPPEPFKSKYAAAPYNGEIAYLDLAVGKLLAQLRARGLYDNSLIAVMADHGEALGEHGEDTHGIFLYDETIRVPLLMKMPHSERAGSRVDTKVGLVDVLPTILEIAHIPKPKAIQGESLVGDFAARARKGVDPKPPSADRAQYAESDYPHRTFGWSVLRAWRTGKYLYIDAPKQELYDQSADPNALHDLSSGSKAVAVTMAEQLEAFRGKTGNSKAAPSVAFDPGLQERLNALGYVASDRSSSPMPGIRDTGADPKDKVRVVNLLHRAEILKEEMRFQESIPLLEQVTEIEPDLPIAQLQLGTALMSVRDYRRAVPVLRKAIVLRPDLTVPHYQLGSALFELEDFQESAKEFEAVLGRTPDWAEARFSLATTYARLERMQDAIREYRKVVEQRPNHYGAHLLLGRALTLTGNASEAITSLEKAASLQPASPEPHAFLADAYLQLGRDKEAERERLEVARLSGGKR